MIKKILLATMFFAPVLAFAYTGPVQSGDNLNFSGLPNTSNRFCVFLSTDLTSSIDSDVHAGTTYNYLSQVFNGGANAHYKVAVQSPNSGCGSFSGTSNQIGNFEYWRLGGVTYLTDPTPAPYTPSRYGMFSSASTTATLATSFSDTGKAAAVTIGSVVVGLIGLLGLGFGLRKLMHYITGRQEWGGNMKYQSKKSRMWIGGSLGGESGVEEI